MEVKKIVEGMTAVEVAEVIDSNFKNQNKILEEDIAAQNSVIGVSEYKDFSEAEAVNVGDVRKYNGFLYECVEATTGAFDASKWKKSSFKAETEKKLSELGSLIGYEQVRDINLIANVAINRQDSEIYSSIKKGTKIHLFVQDDNNLLVDSNDGYLMAADSTGKEYALVINVNKNTQYEVILKHDVNVIWFYRNASKVNGTGNARLILAFPNGALNLVTLQSAAISQLEKESAKVQPIVELFHRKDGENLFNKNASGILNNKYLDATTGKLVDANEMSVSDYIPIQKGKTYTFFVPIVWFGATNSRSVHYYVGEDKQHKRTAGVVNTETSSCTFTSEYDGWIRISYKTIQADSVMVVEGDTYPSIYTPYPLYILQGVEKEGEGELDYSINNPIYGKKILYVGDSIGEGLTAGDGKYGWSGRIAEINKGSYYSKAQSGGVITNGLGSSIPCILDKLTDMANEGIIGDYVILEGGTNDADRIGNATGENKPLAFGSFTNDDFSGSYNNQTFCGAVESLIYTAITSFRGARVGFMIAPKMANSELTKDSYNNRRIYFDTIKNICKKWGIPCLDMWEKGCLNPYIKSHYDNSLTVQGNADAGKLYVDGQHLTAKGYDYLVPLINAWLKSI